MGWKIKQRQDVEPLCPMKSCLCFDLRMGSFLSAVITTVLTFFAWIIVILDMAAWVDPNFEIEGSYFTWWRSQFWKGFYTVDIMMILIHPIILIISIYVMVAILMPNTYKIYSLHPLLQAWYILMILYTICELGVSVYIYSFYGLAAWRLPFLIFCHMYYIIRFVVSVWFIFIVYSYAKEIEAELSVVVHGTGSESTDYLYQPAGAVVNQDELGDDFPRPDFDADVIRYHEARRTPPELQEKEQPNYYPQQELTGHYANLEFTEPHAQRPEFRPQQYQLHHGGASHI